MSISLFTSKKNSVKGGFTLEYGIVGGAIILGIALIIFAVMFGGNEQNTSYNTTTIPSDGRTGLEVGNAPILGNKDAPHTIVEFFDFQCVACVAYFQEIKPLIQKEFIDTGKARLVAKLLYFIDDYAPNKTGVESMRSATASLCANESGMFWDFYNGIFTAEAQEIQAGNQNENSGNLSETFLTNLAQRAGIAQADFVQCLSKRPYEAVLQSYLQDAMVALQGRVGTPSVFIDGNKIDNPFDIESYRKIINQ